MKNQILMPASQKNLSLVCFAFYLGSIGCGNQTLKTSLEAAAKNSSKALSSQSSSSSGGSSNGSSGSSSGTTSGSSGGGPGQPTKEPNGKVYTKNPKTAGNFGYTCVSNENCNGVQPIEMASALTDVFIGNTTGGRLKNSNVVVTTNTYSNLKADGTFTTSTYPEATQDAQGKWMNPNFSTVADQSANHVIAQVMSYYWYEQTIAFAQNAAGPNGWAAKDKAVVLLPRAYDATDVTFKAAGFNAYWNTNQNAVFFSFTGPFQSAEDGGVGVHEYAHANIDYGTNKGIRGNEDSIACPSGQGKCCKDALGCAKALNEAQADVLAYFLFESPRIGEYFMNDTNGMQDRDAVKNANLTATQRFNDPNCGGEVHCFGAPWSAAWWDLKAAIGKEKASKLFFSSIVKLTAKDTFRSALNSLLSTDQQVYNGANRTSIVAAFSKHGITE